MLIKIADWAKCTPNFIKRINGIDVSTRGSFAYGEDLEFFNVNGIERNAENGNAPNYTEKHPAFSTSQGY